MGYRKRQLSRNLADLNTCPAILVYSFSFFRRFSYIAPCFFFFFFRASRRSKRCCSIGGWFVFDVWKDAFHGESDSDSLSRPNCISSGEQQIGHRSFNINQSVLFLLSRAVWFVCFVTQSCICSLDVEKLEAGNHVRATWGLERFVEKRWIRDDKFPAYFSRSRYEIRDRIFPPTFATRFISIYIYMYVETNFHVWW